jgi:hypothetical protein
MINLADGCPRIKIFLLKILFSIPALHHSQDSEVQHPAQKYLDVRLFVQPAGTPQDKSSPWFAFLLTEEVLRKFREKAVENFSEIPSSAIPDWEIPHVNM